MTKKAKENKLIKAASAVAMITLGVLSARSDEIPTLDVRPVCRGIANQAGDSLDAGLQTTFEECVQSEQSVHEQLKKEWSTFSAADKRHCVALAKTGGESSNTELLTCLEMARDVRASRSAAATSSEAATTQAPFSPRPKVRPAPADSTSPPPATNEPPKTKTDRDSVLEELKQAKADARSARDSEATAQRKFADAETDLGRAKEEAGRASKEAEQAKDDAQAARKSQGEAENKLADAERARVAAEGREQACQTAAKSQLGFGTRLRSWFGHKTSSP